MRRTLTLITAVTVLAVLGGGVVAVAGLDDRPQTDQVLAEGELLGGQGRARECRGQDGPYSDFRGVIAATSTGDPRLSGNLELTVQALDNFRTGYGTVQGRVIVRDPATGRQKAAADFSGVDTPFAAIGTLRGHVVDEGDRKNEETSGRGELFANFRVSFDTGGPPVLQIGGSHPDTEMPAVIQSGACTGPFDRFQFSYQQQADGAAARTAGGAATGWRGLID